MVRSIETACSTARCCESPASASQARCATTFGSPGPAGGRPAPQQCTVTSTSLASSRARYSTCTPAPPYTSGGYSRVRSATRRSLLSGGNRLPFADHHDPAFRDHEALAVGHRIDADLGSLGHVDVLVQDRPPHHRRTPDIHV